MILGHEGTLQGPFYQGSPEISLTGSIFGSIGGSRRVKEGPLSFKIFENFEILFRDPLGSRDGPRMVCDSMVVGFCVLRVP